MTLRVFGVAAVAGLLTTATACASNGGDEMQPDEAKQNAVAFLRETMDHEPLAWPEVPDPVATRCSDGDDGVRFQYLVTIDQKTDPKELAASFDEFWRTKGLDVRPAQEDFGKYGVAYSATARKDGKPWGSFQLSQRGISLSVDSQCAEGSPDDYED